MTTIEKYLPKNYVTDGSVDYTAYLQYAIDGNAVVDFPQFPIMVNEKGVIIPSNRKIYFPNLIMKPTDKGSYNLIRIQKSNNVIIYNAVITGDRKTHTGATGEWGHGIAVYGSSNITINNPKVSQCWGDGIYLASTDGVTNTNIIINRSICTNNRRNGMGLTSARGLYINYPTCTYNDGILPMCGIDIEPSLSTDEIQDVVINYPKTEHNPEFGIQIGFKRLFGGSDKTISVTINDHADKYSKSSLKISATLTQRNGNETITGTININNPFWRRNSVAPMQVNIMTKDIKLNITKPVLQDANGVNLTLDQVKATLTKKATINKDASYALSF